MSTIHEALAAIEAQDADGEWYGWGKVLNYLGIEWENEPGQIVGQMKMEEM